MKPIGVRRVAALLAVTLATVAVAACGSGSGAVPVAAAGGSTVGGTGGSGGGGTGGSGGTSGGSGAALMPSFDSIQDNLFTPICTACHQGATAPLGLRLDAVNSYALLVGVASVQEPALKRVDPGNPNGSYLIRKLEGTAGTGGRMPLGGVPLSATDIGIVRQWITDGALRTLPAPVAPIRVTSLAPLPGATLSSPPASITAIFDRELNATSVLTTTFTVERSGGDGTFGSGNEVAIVPVAVTVPLVNPTTAIFDMSTAPPVEDKYRVTLVGTGAATVLDLAANRLDGEFAGTFPSGDGQQGGNFVAEFDVVGLQPTLQSIQTRVLTPRCAGCHTGVGGFLPGAMNLTTASASAASLRNVASVQQPAVLRVAPGDPDASYLIRKIEGTSGIAGVRMPAGGPFLDPTTIGVIRQWIANGAVP